MAVHDYHSALAVFDECLVLMPDDVDVLFRIGEVYYQTGNVDAALVAYETLLLINPDHKPTKSRHAEITKEAR